MTARTAAFAAPRLPVPRLALVWALLSLLMLAVGARNLLAGQFPDPDDVLRMVQLRDLLGGQAWFDTTQYRIDPPGGVPMHWSRLVDVPLALVVLALQPLLGHAAAQLVVAAIMPLLTFGCLILLVGWIAARRFDSEVTGFAALCCGLVPVTVAQFQVLRIDHHGWQIVTVVAATAAVLRLDSARGARIAGLCLSAGLAISLEVLPLAAAFGGLFALRWLVDPAERQGLVQYLATLAIGSALFFLATRGPAALTPWCDAIAPAHLAFFAVVAIACAALAVRRTLPRWAIVGGLALAGAAGLGMFAALAPACLATPFGNLDPLVRDFWYVNVTEGLPVWHQSLGKAATSLVPVLLALAALVQLQRRATGEERRWWREYLLIYGATLLTGLLVWRSLAFTGALAAVPLGWLLSRSLGLLRDGRSRPRARQALAAAALVSVAVAGVMLLGERTRASAAPASDISAAVRESSCALRVNAARLERFAPTTIFAPLDIGPSLIERSHHAVVATGHHRAQAAMHDVIDGFLGDEASARETVTRHGAGLIVVCTDLFEPALYTAHAPDGLMAQLLAGAAPAWLEPVDIGGPEPLKVWRVLR